MSKDSNSNSKALVIVTFLFFMWGFITVLNDILIPHLKSLFDLSYAESMLVQFCFFMAYFVMSLPSGFVVHKIGYRWGMVVGLLVTAAGTALFYPAAQWESYHTFLVAFFILASGITLLQVAANPYVVALGPSKTASSRLNLSQAFNSLGTAIAPTIGAILILSATKSKEEIALLSPEGLSLYRVMEASLVQRPYLIITAILILLALLLAFWKLPIISDETLETPGAKNSENNKNNKKTIWQFPHLTYGVVAIFFYVGGEVAIGSFLVSFLSDPSIAGLDHETAGRYVSLYWGGAMVGRFIGSYITAKISPNKVLWCSALMAFSLVIATIFLDGQWAMRTILCVGPFNSIMFPTIFSLAIRNLGSFTSRGSSLLCMAIVGGAIMPLIQGAFADMIGIQSAFFVPALCYLVIAFYGLKGYSITTASKGEK